METVAKIALALLICCSVGACGLAARQERDQQLAIAVEQQRISVEACGKKFSESNKDAVAIARCKDDADKAYMPFARNPDLISLRMAKRMELAERQAAGKITRAQALLEMAETQTSLMTEEQRRDNANQSVAAQQQAADAALYSAISLPRR